MAVGFAQYVVLLFRSWEEKTDFGLDRTGFLLYNTLVTPTIQLIGRDVHRSRLRHVTEMAMDRPISMSCGCSLGLRHVTERAAHCHLSEQGIASADR